ncbi:MAG TPA: hydrolase [Hyphomicrobiaceae bacterium]|nr:hydrolase [Hyphomicrobiaceae bacterium]
MSTPFMDAGTGRQMIRTACRALLVLSFAVPMAWLTGPARAGNGTIPVGESQFEVGVPRGPVTVHTYRPAAYTASSPVWIVIHGARRGVARHIVADYYDVWAPLAERHGALLLMPEFIDRKWPTSWQFQLGNVRTRTFKPIPWKQTGFAVAEKAFRQAVAMTGSTRRRFSLYGHGAGAQWVQRYVLHSGGRYVDRAVAANAGWYLLPDDEFAFPYGLKRAPIPQSTLRQAFATDFVLLLGQGDTSTGGILRDTPETRAQGKNRYQRGNFYFKRAASAARRLDARFAWRLAEVSSAGHENEDMAPAAAVFLAGGPPTLRK